MMKLANLSKERIKEFAGEVIYRRGVDYFRDDMVEDFQYDPKRFTFQAMVQGSYGFYDVEVWSNRGYLQANCNCPFDGYPCKHIVAVLLYFLENKDKYLTELKKQNDLKSAMSKKLSKLSKDELIKMILTFSENHSTIRRELLLQLSIDDDKSLRSFEKAIDRIFNRCESDGFSTYEISRELKKILKQVEKTEPDFQVKVLWKTISGILYQLNEYGMNDIPFEELVIEALDKFVDLFQTVAGLKENNRKMISELKNYGEWGNCGIIDEVWEAYYLITGDDVK